MFPPGLPPIKNRPLYSYRVFAKWFSFFFFGLATLFLVTVIFPLTCFFIRPQSKFDKFGRRFISSSMQFFIGIMRTLRIVKLEVNDREFYKNLESKIVIANHPSLLDVVMLLSLIPNADCIVNAHLTYSVVGGVIRRLYILNSLDFDDLLKACSESMNKGHCLIIFPEGTRTPRTGTPVIKRGAARVALDSGRNILPLHIGGTDKFGLGKKDPWAGFNPTEPYVYQISVRSEINPEKYKNIPKPVAVRLLTNDIEASLFPQKET